MTHQTFNVKNVVLFVRPVLIIKINVFHVLVLKIGNLILMTMIAFANQDTMSMVLILIANNVPLNVKHANTIL
jgi:hypothetical protein